MSNNPIKFNWWTNGILAAFVILTTICCYHVAHDDTCPPGVVCVDTKASKPSAPKNIVYEVREEQVLEVPDSLMPKYREMNRTTFDNCSGGSYQACTESAKLIADTMFTVTTVRYTLMMCNLDSSVNGMNYSSGCVPVQLDAASDTILYDSLVRIYRHDKKLWSP